jgi:hypothetical protein
VEGDEGIEGEEECVEDAEDGVAGVEEEEEEEGEEEEEAGEVISIQPMSFRLPQQHRYLYIITAPGATPLDSSFANLNNTSMWME